MTDIQAATTDFASWRAERTARVDAELHHLKQAVIPSLRTANIASVEIRFDGYGDSGAVDEIACRDASGQALACPDVAIDVASPDGPEDPGEIRQELLQSALESLTYLALERHHPGWEDNEGAAGTLEIEVATQTFMLDCKVRYIEHDDYYTEL